MMVQHNETDNAGSAESSTPARGRRKKRDSIVNRLFSRSNSRGPEAFDGEGRGWKTGVGYGGSPILSRDQQKSFRKV